MPYVAWKIVTMALVVAVVQLCSIAGVEAFAFLSQPDKITLLPGQPQVGFQQYSGYVTVDNKKQRALFYYFAEAETDPHSKPLVLWLNGGSLFSLTCPSFFFKLIYILIGFCCAGPGCSSLGVGAFSENGPFRPSREILVRNEYSWNRGKRILLHYVNAFFGHY